MADTAIKVSIIGDASKLSGALKDAEGQAKTFGSKMTAVGAGLTAGLTVPLVAGAIAATKAAADEQQQMETLANSIRQNIPDATDEMIAANEDWITSMQQATGVADGEMRQAMQHLVTSGMSLEEAQKNVAIAMDIAAAKGKPLATVTEAINKANQGNIGALGRLGIATRDASGAYMTLDEIMATAEDRMGGSAAAAADTAAGRSQILKTQMDDLSESIGMVLLPVMEKLVGWLSKITGWFNELSPEAQTVIVILGGVAAAIGPILILIPKLVSGFKMIVTGFKLIQATLAANPYLLLIAATIALVILIVKNWDKITAFLKKTWDGIRKGIQALKDWIITTWNSIISFFQGLPNAISRAVSGMFDGLKQAFRNAINWIISKWNNFRLSIKLPSLLGGGTIRIDTPNIPTFHQGGVFHAGGKREGLALLRDGETVLPPGRAGTGPAPIYVTINAGMGADPNAISRAVVEALQRYQRANGAIPIRVSA